MNFASYFISSHTHMVSLTANYGENSIWHWLIYPASDFYFICTAARPGSREPNEYLHFIIFVSLERHLRGMMDRPYVSYFNYTEIKLWWDDCADKFHLRLFIGPHFQNWVRGASKRLFRLTDISATQI